MTTLLAMIGLWTSVAVAAPASGVPDSVHVTAQTVAAQPAEDRAEWVSQMRLRANVRLQHATRAWQSAPVQDQACRKERLDQVRLLLDRTDSLERSITDDTVRVEVRQAALLAVGVAAHPVWQLDAGAPCRLVAQSRRRRWTGPDAWAALPEPIEDDPLTLGFDAERRALKPR